MNPLQKILGQMSTVVSGLINGMNSKTVKMIQQVYYFVIFLLIMVGIIVGYSMGRDSAKIQSPPLAPLVNDTFEFDISREKSDGDFTGTLESSLISESRYSEPDKIKFPARENLEPEVREQIIENRHGKMPDTEQFNTIEGTYRPSPDDISDVRMLDKTESPSYNEKTPSVDLKPLEREEGKIKEKERSQVKMIRERAEIKSIDEPGKGSKAPAPMEKTSDIFEK